MSDKVGVLSAPGQELYRRNLLALNALTSDSWVSREVFLHRPLPSASKKRVFCGISPQPVEGCGLIAVLEKMPSISHPLALPRIVWNHNCCKCAAILSVRGGKNAEKRIRDTWVLCIMASDDTTRFDVVAFYFFSFLLRKIRRGHRQ